jgi:hypothetical protein
VISLQMIQEGLSAAVLGIIILPSQIMNALPTLLNSQVSVKVNLFL